MILSWTLKSNEIFSLIAWMCDCVDSIVNKFSILILDRVLIKGEHSLLGFVLFYDMFTWFYLINVGILFLVDMLNLEDIISYILICMMILHNDICLCKFDHNQCMNLFVIIVWLFMQLLNLVDMTHVLKSKIYAFVIHSPLWTNLLGDNIWSIC